MAVEPYNTPTTDQPNTGDEAESVDNPQEDQQETDTADPATMPVTANDVGSSNGYTIPPARGIHIPEKAPFDPANPNGVPTYRDHVRGLATRPYYSSDYAPSRGPHQISVDGHTFSEASYQNPNVIIGDQMRSLQQEQAALNKSAQDLVGTKNMESVPDPYKRGYDEFVIKTQQDFINSVVKSYGGNENKASKALMDPFSPVHQRWVQINQGLNDRAHSIKYKFTEAQNTVNGMDSGNDIYDQKAHDAANELIRGYSQLGGNGYGDYLKLEAADNNYEKHVTPIHFLKASGFDQAMKSFVDKNPDKISGWHNGFYVTDIKSKEFAEQRIDRIADSLYPQFSAHYTKPEFRQWMHDHYPTRVEQRTIVTKPNQPRAGSGEGKVTLGGIERGYDTVGPQANVNRSQVESGNVPTPSVYRSPVAVETAGKQEELTKKEFRNVNNTPVTIQPKNLAIDQKTGEIFIEGPTPEIQELDTDAKKLELKIQDYTSIIGKTGPGSENYVADKPETHVPYDAAVEARDKAVEELDTKTKSLEDLRVPYRGNEAKAHKFLGGEKAVKETIENLKAARELDIARSTPNAQVSSGTAQSIPKSAADFDSQWVKLPKGGKLVGPDGVEYTKK